MESKAEGFHFKKISITFTMESLATCSYFDYEGWKFEDGYKMTNGVTLMFVNCRMRGWREALYEILFYYYNK